ncbi:MAG: hypothetical protein P4N60_12720 [Verrucomicrobiae bacterium]|nr:hypothetical protein [Verrucomicrobiae bacterium]
MENISDYLQRRLTKFNETAKKIDVLNEQSYMDKVRDSIIRANNLSSRVEFEGINNEAIRNEIMLQVPKEFGAPQPKTYISHSSQGDCKSFGIEVI